MWRRYIRYFLAASLQHFVLTLTTLDRFVEATSRPRMDISINRYSSRDGHAFEKASIALNLPGRNLLEIGACWSMHDFPCPFPEEVYSLS